MTHLPGNVQRHLKELGLPIVGSRHGALFRVRKGPRLPRNGLDALLDGYLGPSPMQTPNYLALPPGPPLDGLPNKTSKSTGSPNCTGVVRPAIRLTRVIDGVRSKGYCSPVLPFANVAPDALA